MTTEQSSYYQIEWRTRELADGVWYKMLPDEEMHPGLEPLRFHTEEEAHTVAAEVCDTNLMSFRIVHIKEQRDIVEEFLQVGTITNNWD